MKKIIKFSIRAFCLSFVCWVFASCAARQGFVSSVTRSDIDRVQRFDIISEIGFIEKGNQIVFDDSLAMVAAEIFDSVLFDDSVLPVSGFAFIEDEATYTKVQNEVFLLMDRIFQNARPKDLVIPPTIDSILEANNERFGLLVYDWGFVRDRCNFAGQVVKSIAGSLLVGILTMGTVYYSNVPIKEMTRCGIIIVDSQNNNLAFVAKAERELNPLEPKTYNKLKKVLMRRFNNN